LWAEWASVGFRAKGMENFHEWDTQQMQKKKKKAHIDAFTGDRVLFYIWVLHNAFTTIYELFSLKLIIILIT
jgi:hypothetical protein